MSPQAQNWLSWRTIAQELGVGIGTVRRAAQARAKNVRGPSFKTGAKAPPPPRLPTWEFSAIRGRRRH